MQLCQWSVRGPRAVAEKHTVGFPLLTGQRILDALVPRVQQLLVFVVPLGAERPSSPRDCQNTRIAISLFTSVVGSAGMKWLKY